MSFRTFASGARMVGLVALVALGQGALPAAAQTAGAPQPGQVGNADIGETYGDWTGACETVPGGARECYIFQTVKDAQNGRAMMSLKAGYFLQGNEPSLIVDVPASAGVAIPPGVGLTVDAGQEGRAPYNVCTPSLCRSVIRLDDELLTRMKAGSQLFVGFLTAGGQQVKKPASLSGFTAGWGSVVK